MRNIRAELEAELGQPMPDETWQYAVKHGYAAEIERGSSAAAVAAELKEMAAAVGLLARPGVEREHRERPAGVATSARIDALSAIYAAWATHDQNVRWFRSGALVDRSTPEFFAWVRRQGPYPDYRLRDEDEVHEWVIDRFRADAADGDGDRHIRDLVSRSMPDRKSPVTDLWYIAEGQERPLTVDARGTLGDLAKLAGELADRYRWRPSEAATFVLTGRTPEVNVYVGGAQIRWGATGATTRVTMTLDPFLTPDQVAAIYTRLRSRFSPTPPPRSQGVRRYRLAQHVGPHVMIHVQRPGDRTGPGRRPRPGPAGVVQIIEPVGGQTWQSLRRTWNEKYGDQVDEHGRPLRYESASNFNRDAQLALRQLLFPGWRSDPIPASTAAHGQLS